jgi:hypothetical protein
MEMKQAGRGVHAASTGNAAKRPNLKRRERRAPVRWRRAIGNILLAWVVFQLLPTQSPAADKLRADLIVQGPRARNAAPIPVEALFKWDSTRILEGRLELEFLEGNRVLGRYRSGELALTGGEQTFRMLLPPSLAPFSDSQVQVRMKFVAGGNVIDLEPSVVFVPVANERSLVVGWCNAGTSGGWLRGGIEQNLLVEKFAPPADSIAQRLLMTSAVRLEPEELPAQPLGYTSFDVVVLTATGFKEARERQLLALARWVKGGGSVCVYVGGGLQPYHVSFLNQLAEANPGGPAFASDNAGNLLPAPKDLMRLRSGLGRSVIVPEAIVADLITNAPACRQAATFLWKMRSSKAQAIIDSGQWERPPAAAGETNYDSAYRAPRFTRNPNPYAEPLSYAVQPTPLGAELMNLLMPRTVRLIPFSALMGLLVLFVLVIGPVDYFILGLLRRRRLTWVLFPATSLAFTVATVLMANHYLGLRDQRRALIVVDLGQDGTALRWNRYELVFAARDKQSVTELKDALWAPLDVRASSPGVYPGMPGQPGFNPGYAPMQGRPPNAANPYPYSQASGYSGDRGRESDPPLYDGVLPVHFQASETIRQWRPEMNRTFSFEPPPVALPANWRAVEAAWPNLPNIRAKLSDKKPFDGDLFAISGSGSITTDSLFPGILPASILRELCVGDSRGLLSLFSQVSPTGGGNFEDASAMDTIAGDAVLAIETRSGDDIVVYRRFFYGN